MKYDLATYGDTIADCYDDLYGYLDPSECVTALCDLSRGPALELGIGTGRVAIPLAATGMEVQGVDGSQAMLDRFRAKPGSTSIKTHVGDFADVHVDGSFGLVYVVFNTFFVLLDQDAQLRCFKNVAAHLRDDGVFVTETFVPDPARFVRDQVLQTLRIEADRVVLEATKHDRASQTLESQLILLGNNGTRLLPIRLRYAWPTELDLMAKLAGLTLADRWSSWRRAPFTSASNMHVSIYKRA